MNIDKNEMIITIDSEPGTNADGIARKISNILQIPCYSEEILDRASQISGISRDLMHRYDGRAVRAAYDLLAEDESAIRMASAADFITAQVFASRQLASEGSCILVDRHANAALDGYKKHISIFLHAEVQDRAKVIAQQKGISEEDAMKSLKRTDRAYRNYYKGNNKGWGDANNYDLTVNASDAEKEEDMADIIVSLLETLTGMHLRRKMDRHAV